MSTAGSSDANHYAPSDGRARATRIIAGFMALSAITFGVATATFGIAMESQQIHGFHNAMVAALLLVLSAPAAITVSRRPKQSGPALMVLTALSIAALATMTVSLTADPFTLPFVALTAVLWTVRPTRGGRGPGMRPSFLLLGLVLAASVPLTIYALDQAELQRTLVDNEHSQFFHWVESSFYAVAILALGLLAGAHPSRYRLGALSAGAALSIFGAASLVLDNHASAISAPWAWAALIGGAAFVLIARWQAKQPITTTPGHGPHDTKAHR